MSYAAIEASIDDGSVVELFEFAQGTQSWYYCTSLLAVEYNSITYENVNIKRDKAKQTQDTLKQTINLEFPINNLFANQFLGFSPDETTSVLIRRGHSTDLAVEYPIEWKGRVVGSKVSGATIVLECESIFSIIMRSGLRARYEFNCRHSLYSSACGVNKELNNVSTSVVSTTGLVILTTSLAGTNVYTGGILLCSDGSSRFITYHNSTTIHINRYNPSISASDTVIIYKGCDKTQATCISKFNNILNFGGFPYIPVERNPYGGGSVA